jgi:hypothetical protein
VIFEVAEALRVPVLILTVLALCVVLVELGGFAVELLRRRRRDLQRPRTVTDETRRSRFMIDPSFSSDEPTAWLVSSRGRRGQARAQPADGGRSRDARAGRSAVPPPSGGRAALGAAVRGGAWRAGAAAAARRVLCRRASAGICPTSASQYGQIFQRGSSGLPHTPHGSLSRRRQLGQRRNAFSTSNPQYWQ